MADRTLTGIRALIVDDHEDTRDALRHVLEWAGATVRLAASGRTALDLAAADPPHLVLCDVRMPGMDGFAVLAGLREIPAPHRMRVVAITGLGRDADVRRSLEAGFDGHLVKPIDYDLLMGLLIRLVGVKL
jgi:two-component system, chemotaxis family, CheB/CheR fusion protein